jgi:probable addiction module antidote protein
LEHLKDPRASAGFLNAALEDSDEMFLLALRDVAEAFQMSKVAAEAGVSRESIYRMLQKTGNPTYASLTSILRALGLRIAVEADIMNRPPKGTKTSLDETASTSDKSSGAHIESTEDSVVISIDRSPRWHYNRFGPSLSDTIGKKPATKEQRQTFSSIESVV